MFKALMLVALGLQADEAAVCRFELLEPSRIVAINWTGVALVSDDGGKSWGRSPSIWMRDSLRVGDSEVWGLSYALDAKLARSSDRGKTWSVVDLDPKRSFPMAFLGSRNGVPVMVDQEGQVWEWERAKELKPDGLNWKKLGIRNPDGKASGGILLDDILYIGSWGKIWRSSDLGASWSAFESGDAQYVEFASSTSACWAATREGAIFRVGRGRQNWTLVASIPDVFFVFSMAVKGDDLLVAGEQEPLAFVVAVHRDGRFEPLTRPPGKQAYHVQVDRSGSVWVATSAGLFEYAGDTLRQHWPAH